MKTNWILWTYGCLCGNMVTPEGGSALADILFGEVNPVVEPSTVNVMLGSSSDDIRGTGSFAITRADR